MAVVAVAFDGQRLNDAEANTNWSNLGGGGPAPAAEPQLKYQGNNAVNRKVTSTGGTRTGVQFEGGTARDMTSATYPLIFLKGYVADFGDLNATYGCEMRVGSSSGNYYDYNVAGSGANRAVFTTYPAIGGYLIVAIDPNIAAWREGTTGTPVLTAVDYAGFAAGFVAGGAKSENVAMDAIDIGRGLVLTGGDGGDTDGVFQNFVDTDQGTVNNRWGVVTQASGVIFARGLLSIGRNAALTAVATGFTTSPTTVLVFPDGYHGPGDVGVLVDLGHASTVGIRIDNLIVGRGSSTTSDTRPDFTVVNTTGSMVLAATIVNHRNVTLTSAVDCDDADIQCDLLTQASAEIQNSIIRTTSASGVACLQDPTFGATDLHDTEFVQEGAGHAIELDTATTYDFTNLFFTGYGANTQNDAAIFVSAPSGTVTINVSGGDTPTYRSAGATVVINNTVNVTLTGLQANSEVTIVRTSDETVLFNVENSGTSETYLHDGTTVNVDILVFHVNYDPIAIAETLDATARSIPIQQIEDLVYSNP